MPFTEPRKEATICTIDAPGEARKSGVDQSSFSKFLSAAKVPCARIPGTPRPGSRAPARDRLLSHLMSADPKSIKGTPIRDLGLTIAGTELEPIVARFMAEIDAVGLGRVRPRLYLSTEWGVPFETIAVAIPFYLARPELTELYRQKREFVEGNDPEDILRYLRHELGHVVNYAYRLFDEPEWVRLFGSMTQPYEEEYRPQPFHPGFVTHLPGWYAQKHPDEDWAETFAVWMTSPAWRKDYAGRPAPSQAPFVDATIARVRSLPPLVASDELDEDVSEIDGPSTISTARRRGWRRRGRC